MPTLVAHLFLLMAGLTAGPEDEVAARGLDSTVTFAEYDALALDRHALSENGRAALKHLLRAEVLERLAVESHVTISEAAVDVEWRKIEEQVVSAGEGAGMDEYLRKNRVDPATMRRFLRLGIIHETLARQALGIPTDRAVPAEQQEMWLDQLMKQRGEDLPAPPWEGDDPVVARCGNLQVRLSTFRPHLRSQIAGADVREDCYQMLLAKRLRARTPDLAPEAIDKAIDLELERRRAQFAADPKYQGLTYDQIMAATGLRLDRLRHDPAIVIAALSKLWVERAHGQDGLRATYQAERALFDGRYGESVELSVIFLQAAVMKNQLNPRSFEDAELELSRLKEKIDGAATFAELAKTRSEDGGTRESGGRLGHVTAAAEGVPEVLRVIAFDMPNKGLVGPVRIGTGVVLVWVGPKHPAPGWEVMSQHVENELRRRLLDEVLPKDSVTTWLDE
jgi:hypothetical protein